jgi:hypothetical protein
VGLSENKKIRILQKKKKNCLMGEGVALQQKWGLYNCQEYTEHPQGHKLKSGRKKGKGEN